MKGAEIIARKTKDILLAPGATISISDRIPTPITNKFQWYFNGHPIAGATHNFYETSQNGRYSVSESSAASNDIIVSSYFDLKLNKVSTKKVILNAASLNVFQSPGE